MTERFAEALANSQRHRPPPHEDVYAGPWPDGNPPSDANDHPHGNRPDKRYSLSVAFADELPDAFTPPDELVEGVLTAGDGSVLYGDSNSGKTFLAIDMACAVARGASWMGRRTEPGLVIYLAAESPSSVRARLQAYQKHHGVRVPNFAIVQSPIDLFDGEADADAVIELVRQIEAQRGQRARLIVGDTLARLSAGANENAGQDMGLVVRRFDRIRTECKAHFLLVHHSGKAAAAGARGWSGIRAAIDTEIEVTDSPKGRCAEITKQRDLNSKGERIGFRLDPVTLGETKWGAPATSCVVVSCDAPERPQGKRMGEVEGAVVEFLAAHKVGIKKAGVVAHFEGRYRSASVYRAMKKLVIASAIHEAAGMVAIAVAAK
jgi:putative DNA primase/helicase